MDRGGGQWEGAAAGWPGGIANGLLGGRGPAVRLLLMGGGGGGCVCLSISISIPILPVAETGRVMTLMSAAVGLCVGS